MASALQRLGLLSYDHRRLVLGVWVVLLIGIGVLSSAVSKPFTNEFSTPGTNSQQATDLLTSSLPAAAGGSGKVVVASDGGLTSAKDRAAITRSVAAAKSIDGIASISDPYAAKAISKDGTVARVDVQFDKRGPDIADSTRDRLAAAFAPARDAGLQVERGGDAIAPAQTGGATELIGIGVAVVVLAITFGSLLAAGLPLLTAIIGVALGLLGITGATALVDLNSSVTSLALMLGLAVGIDYALFILSRHRSQVARGVGLRESAGRAVATAGSAVVFAGATVVIALAALFVCGVPFLTAMGFAAAATVAVAVLIALTLVPALLGFAGLRATKGKAIDAHSSERPTLGRRWVSGVVRHRIPAVVVVTTGLLALAIPALDMRLGLPGDGSKPTSKTERRAYDLLSKGFGVGYNGQLTVVAKLPDSGAKAAATAVASKLKTLDDVTAVSTPTLAPGDKLAIIGVTPSSGPSSVATEDLVRAVRTQRSAQGEDLLVTGTTAVNIDVAQRMSDSLLPYLLVVVGLALILLTIAFRSILVPVTAVAGFLLTILATFGAVVAVFQHGFAANLIGVSETAPIISFLPILAIGILFGLAMDYQVFLVSRMSEEHTRGADAHGAIVNGFSHSGRVVTAAALIMISVFSGFIIPDDAIIKSIGFALAFGVLVDAFLVRMTLIPALMAILGKSAWAMPSWLGRVVPDVDIEGARLDPRREPEPAAG